jgi:hypothetical protein
MKDLSCQVEIRHEDALARVGCQPESRGARAIEMGVTVELEIGEIRKRFGRAAR